MEEHDQHHQAGTPVMDTTDQPAITDPGHDVLDAVVGMVGRRDVINCEHDARNALQEEQEQAGTSQGEKPVDFRYLAIKDRIVDGL